MFTRVGISTVAEGVETAAQAARAVQYADYVQGFFYARPMSEQALSAFFTENSRGK